MRWSLSVLMVLCGGASASGGTIDETSVFADADPYVYRTVDDVALQAWVFQPDAQQHAGLRPAVVFFFGGGWRRGTPAQFVPQCRYLQSRGVIGIVCDYRVLSRHGVKAVSCVQDAKSAIRWVRQNAERLGLDPNRICAAGGSAGGHLACSTGVVPGLDAADEDLNVSSLPDAMALFNPAVMLAPEEGVTVGEELQEKLSGMATRTGIAPIRISPIHHLRAGLPPTIIFHGTADTVVPFVTVREFTRRSRKLGNDVTLVPYADAPHGFFNPRTGTTQRADDGLQWYRGTIEQLDRFLGRLGWVNGEPTERSVGRHVRIRRYLDASRQSLESGGMRRVAFLGGSITEMEGYRPRVASWIQEQFPQTKIEFTNAGIASTCSHTGAFRLQRDVLSGAPVDLLLVEFAVNDDQDAGHSAVNCLRGMEGVIRHALRSNPQMDIVMIHFVNESMLALIAEGKEPLSSREHERIARHYGVSSVYLSRYVQQEIADGRMTWRDYGGTHPGPAGNDLAAGLVKDLLRHGWRQGCPSQEPIPYQLPQRLEPSSFAAGRLVPAAEVKADLSPEWQCDVPDWSSLPGNCRRRYQNSPLLHTSAASAALSTEFHGSAIGAWVLAGPDAGVVRFRIDGGAWQSMDLLHRFSGNLHYPRTVMFAHGLAHANHRLELSTEPAASDGRGSAVRVLALVVND